MPHKNEKDKQILCGENGHTSLELAETWKKKGLRIHDDHWINQLYRRFHNIRSKLGQQAKSLWISKLVSTGFIQMNKSRNPWKRSRQDYLYRMVWKPN